MQLTVAVRIDRLVLARLVAAWLIACVGGGAARANAQQSGVEAGSSTFYEFGGPLHMLVVVPQVNAQVEAVEDTLAVQASWTADVVSGASVAVVDAPATRVDAISSATVHDTRHVFGGGVTLRDTQSSLAVGYRYGFENDYRSHGIDATARTELFDRNTSFELGYSRSFDHVCDGPGAEDPALKQRLDSSTGCFEDSAEGRESRALDANGLQLAWTQVLSPIVVMQLGTSAQVQHGFLSNPYRAVRIGETAAQEHHPGDRGRYAATLGLRIWLDALSGALQPSLRVYRDTWDMRALSAELGYEQRLDANVRLRARGRLHAQTSAAFYSDDYVLAPRGRYFTGDRELSPLRTLLAGVQLTWTVPPADDGTVLGLLSDFELSLKGDLLKTYFFDFHYGEVAPPNDTAILGTLSLSARL